MRKDKSQPYPYTGLRLDIPFLAYTYLYIRSILNFYLPVSH